MDRADDRDSASAAAGIMVELSESTIEYMLRLGFRDAVLGAEKYTT